MLKRTIVVLAALSMVVALIPAAAFAGAADITGVEVTVKDGAAAAVVGATVNVLDGTLSVWGGTNPTLAGGTTGNVVTIAGNYDGDANTPVDLPQKGDAVVVTATIAGVTYYFNATLTDADADGKSLIAVVVPTAGSGTITGDIEYDSNTGATDTITPMPGAETVSVWKGGVLFATVAGAAAANPAVDYSILTGPGAFTVSVDITDAMVTLLNRDVDAPATLDEGEIQFFSKKGVAAAATVVNVGVGITVTGVNFLYENEDSNLNPLTFDHIDAGKFTDMLGHWAEADATAAAAASLVTGCTATTFCPEADITRAEFSAILGRQITGNVIPVVVVGPYPDVAPGHWAAGWIQALKGAGVVTGDAAGMFNPDAPITRAEAAAMLARWAIASTLAPGAFIADVADGPDAGAGCSVADLPAATLSFIDVPTTHWASKMISWEYNNGVVKGNTNGTFGPDTNISRAEMVALTMRAYAKAGKVCT
jgi:hypothetical protein